MLRLLRHLLLAVMAMAAFTVVMVVPLAFALLLVLALCMAGLVLAFPVATRQLDYRRRWLDAVELLTTSDEARDQALAAHTAATYESQAWQKRSEELSRQLEGWQLVAVDADEAIRQIRSEAFSAGWDAYANELKTIHEEERATLVAQRRAAREETGWRQARIAQHLDP